MSAPPWTFTPIDIRLDLTALPSVDNSLYIRHIRSILDEYLDHQVCLTDGSKSKHGTGYAYSISGSIAFHRIRNIASVYTAELMAIQSCLSHIAQLPPNSKYLLLTDSLSSLHSLQDSSPLNPLVQRILLILHSLSSINCKITFMWIPGHINLPEHDAVDLAAKRATSLSRITDNSPLPASDFKNHFSLLISNNWKLRWKEQLDNKLVAIKQNPVPWSSSVRNSRREEVTLTRLRIGHTRLTHSHLLNPYILSGPSCSYCQEDSLSVSHFFSCPQLQSLRTSLNVESTLPLALRNNSNTVTVSIQYLKATNFFHLI